MLQDNRLKLCTEAQIYGSILITLMLKVPEQAARHSVAYGRLLLAINFCFVGVPLAFEFIHSEHVKRKAKRAVLWDTAPRELEASDSITSQAPTGLDHKITGRARQKFDQLDADNSGALQVPPLPRNC